MSQIRLTPPGGAVAAPNGSFAAPSSSEGHFGEHDHNSRPADDWQRRMVKALGRKPRLAVVLALIVAVLLAAAGVRSVTRTPTTWTSSALMLIDDEPALATAGDDGQLLKFDELRLKYAALAGTDLIAQPVANELHLPLAAVLGAVSAIVPSESLLMEMTATWSNPQVAQRLAQAAAEQVSRFVQYEAAVSDIPTIDRYTFKVIDPASAATAHGPSHADAVTLAAGLAVGGFAIVFVATQFWRSRRFIFRTS